MKTGRHLLSVVLFGACNIEVITQNPIRITGAKHKALIALLCTAPFGRRTRGYLQESLWGTVNYETGRQNLRRALSDIKRILGVHFKPLISASNSEVALDLSKVKFQGQPGNGTFLEGLEIPVNGYLRWRDSIRDNPSQIYALYSLKAQSVETTVKPTITVLPFTLTVGDPSHNFLGDWIAEEVCRSMSRSNLVQVISHLSSREIAKKAIELSLIRAAFKVDYCVAGSLRAIDDQIILDADFIDARSGHIIWTRRFQNGVSDFLNSSSSGIEDIVRSIGASIADISMSHVAQNQMRDLQDHQMLIAAVGLMHQMTLAAFAKSRELLNEILKRAPNSAEVHAWLAEWYVMSIFTGWSTDRAQDIQKARNSISRALDIDPDNSFCITIDGVVHNNLLQSLDTAEARFNSALDKNPNQALCWLLKGVLHAYRDDAENAVQSVDKACLLSPLDPFQYFYESLSSSAYLSAEKYDRALELATSATKKNSRDTSSLRVRISALHHLGRKQDAQIAARELLIRVPDFKVASYIKQHPAADFQIGKKMELALRASGIS